MTKKQKKLAFTRKLRKAKDAKMKFDSASVIYELAIAEYQNEISRTSILDTKIGVLFPISATYFFLLMGKDGVRNKVKSLFESTFTWDRVHVVELLAVLCVIIAYASVALFTLAVMTHSYDMIESSQVNSKEYFEKDPDEFKAVFTSVYISAIEKNKEVNDKRSKRYLIGVILLPFSLALFFFVNILG